MGDLGEGSLEGQGHPRDVIYRNRWCGGTGGRGGCRQTAEWGTADSVRKKNTKQTSKSIIKQVQVRLYSVSSYHEHSAEVLYFPFCFLQSKSPAYIGSVSSVQPLDRLGPWWDRSNSVITKTILTNCYVKLATTTKTSISQNLSMMARLEDIGVFSCRRTHVYI